MAEVDLSNVPRELLERFVAAYSAKTCDINLCTDLQGELRAALAPAPVLRAEQERDAELRKFMVDNFAKDDLFSAFNAPTANAIWCLLLEPTREPDPAPADAAYTERNQLVAYLASRYPAGTRRTEIEGWDPEWHGCVLVDTPEGQMSWHYHDREAHLFAHLPNYSKEWDGHTTPDKYERLARLTKCPAPAEHPKPDIPSELPFDGHEQAKLFRAMALHLGYSDMPLDWLTGWFCNAAMRGFDEHARRHPAPAEGQRQLTEAERELCDYALASAPVDIYNWNTLTDLINRVRDERRAQEQTNGAGVVPLVATPARAHKPEATSAPAGHANRLRRGESWFAPPTELERLRDRVHELESLQQRDGESIADYCERTQPREDAFTRLPHRCRWDCPDPCPEHDKSPAPSTELERLRGRVAELEAQYVTYSGDVNRAFDRAESAEADLSRLRTALGEIRGGAFIAWDKGPEPLRHLTDTIKSALTKAGF